MEKNIGILPLLEGNDYIFNWCKHNHLFSNIDLASSPNAKGWTFNLSLFFSHSSFPDRLSMKLAKRVRFHSWQVDTLIYVCHLLYNACVFLYETYRNRRTIIQTSHFQHQQIDLPFNTVNISSKDGGVYFSFA